MCATTSSHLSFFLIFTLLAVDGLWLVEFGGHTGRPVYTGLRDVVTQVVKNDGLLGFYRGIVPNFMKGIPVCDLVR